MHVAEIPYQSLQILPAHASLGGWDVQEVAQFLEIALWEGDRPCLGVYNPPKDLLDALPISLTVKERLDRHLVLGFPI